MANTPLNPFQEQLQQALDTIPDRALFEQDAQIVARNISDHAGFIMNFGKRSIWIGPGVYPPGIGSSTHLIIGHWASVGADDLTGLRVLDVGCGSGALALFQLDRNAMTVVATDIDPEAVRCARHNLDPFVCQGRARVLESDLFAALAGEQFDMIVFNQPFHHPENPSDGKPLALESVDGDVFKRFLDQADQHLADDGQILVTFSNYSNPQLLNHPKWTVELLAMDWTRRAAHTRALIRLTRK